MRAAGAVLFCCLATPAVAETALSDFLAKRGCTLGPEARAEAEQAGFDTQAIDAALAGWAEAGQLSQQGDYAVLSPEICTIQLPDIAPVYTMQSPEIAIMFYGPGESRANYLSDLRTRLADTEDAAARTRIEEDIAFVEADAYNNGCYLRGDLRMLFAVRAGGEGRGAGEVEYIDFLGANIMTGDLRFYSPDVLRTPTSFQSMLGDCADIPEGADIQRSHGDFAARYRAYIRAMNASVDCDAGWAGEGPTQIAASLQGYDPGIPADEQPPINTLAWLEYDLVAMANGLHIGVGSGERSQPRPPMCFRDAPPPW